MMNFTLLSDNLTNPALLFFILGILAVYLKSDLAIPENSSKFISLYLLFAIGFKGGQELSHDPITLEIGWSMLFGIGISLCIPLYTFFILKRKLEVYDAGAIAAAYGSVSAVTFVTAVAYLETQQLQMKGHMVAIMALMESPAIIMGLVLIRLFVKEKQDVFCKGQCLLYRRSCSYESFSSGGQSRLISSYGPCSHLSGEHYDRHASIFSCGATHVMEW